MISDDETGRMTYVCNLMTNEVRVRSPQLLFSWLYIQAEIWAMEV